jgi:hypothetical protein
MELLLAEQRVTSEEREKYVSCDEQRTKLFAQLLESLVKPYIAKRGTVVRTVQSDGWAYAMKLVDTKWLDINTGVKLLTFEMDKQLTELFKLAPRSMFTVSYFDDSLASNGAVLKAYIPRMAHLSPSELHQMREELHNKSTLIQLAG